MNRKPLILAIDDTPVNLKTLVAALSDDYELQIATSGAKGLEYAMASAPDLILLDIMMPVMDGYEVCRRLKAESRTRNIPVIFVTALSESEAEASGLELGAVDYLTKPINVPIAKRRIHNHIEREQMRKIVEMQRDELERLAHTDSLTGVINRRHFLELAEQELERAHRHGDALSILMIDIDHFKRINDQYGHQTGDIALQRLTSWCLAVLRSFDVFGRLGGEEFVALLPRSDAVGAREVAERLRLTVEAAEIVLDDSLRIRFTISVGVTTLSAVPDGKRKTIETLLNQADQALYQAKNAGRNRVCVYDKTAS